MARMGRALACLHALGAIVKALHSWGIARQYANHRDVLLTCGAWIRDVHIDKPDPELGIVMYRARRFATRKEADNFAVKNYGNKAFSSRLSVSP
jgi:hypothetical protein